ncbi:MAG: hypothetical protein JWQ49_4166 [Edaphobacter sp.]|nr:hypothetical protein [Edaphobacter sp.]
MQPRPSSAENPGVHSDALAGQTVKSHLAGGQSPVGHFVLHKIAEGVGTVIMDLQWLFFAALGCVRVPGIRLHLLDGLLCGLTAKSYQPLIENHGGHAKHGCAKVSLMFL